MNELISAAAAGLTGAIVVTHEEVTNRGVKGNKAYAVTQAIILGAVVKMVDCLKEGENS